MKITQTLKIKINNTSIHLLRNPSIRVLPNRPLVGFSLFHVLLLYFSFLSAPLLL
jgi:hypothetical protein